MLQPSSGTRGHHATFHCPPWLPLTRAVLRVVQCDDIDCHNCDVAGLLGSKINAAVLLIPTAARLQQCNDIDRHTYDVVGVLGPKVNAVVLLTQITGHLSREIDFLTCL